MKAYKRGFGAFLVEIRAYSCRISSLSKVYFFELNPTIR